MLALAEDVVGATEALAEAPAAPSTPGGRHDVGALGGLHVVRLPAETQEHVLSLGPPVKLTHIDIYYFFIGLWRDGTRFRKQAKT